MRVGGQGVVVSPGLGQRFLEVGHQVCLLLVEEYPLPTATFQGAVPQRVLPFVTCLAMHCQGIDRELIPAARHEDLSCLSSTVWIVQSISLPYILHFQARHQLPICVLWDDPLSLPAYASHV